jgi:flagellar hook-length control protein FliK
MDMQTISTPQTPAAQSGNSVGASASDKTASPAGGAKAPVKDAQGNLVATNDSGAKKTGFAAIMQQMFGEDEAMSASGNPAAALNVATLLAGLISNLPDSVASTDAGDTATANGDSQDIADLLANNPQLMDQLLQQPKFQLWLDQAAVVLQSLNLLPGNFTQASELPDTASVAKQSNPLLLMNAQQAQTILAVFQAAEARTPGNAGLQQLMQSFQQMMNSLSASGIQLPSETKRSDSPLIDARIARKNDAGQAVVSADSANSASTVTKAGNSLPANSGASTKDTGAEVQLEAKPKSLLQVMAAKAMNSTAGNSSTAIDSAMNVPNPALQQAVSAAPAFVQPTVNSLYFTRDMTQFVMNQLHIVQANGVSEATITLYPQHLGQVDVKLTMQDGVLTAQFTAGTALGKDLLENQLPQLRAALQTQGLQVDKLVVNQSASMQQGMFHGQAFQQQSQFNQQSKNRQRGISYEGSGDDFSIELSSVAQMRAAAYGNSFDVSA